jgi:hypothetical protein
MMTRKVFVLSALAVAIGAACSGQAIVTGSQDAGSDASSRADGGGGYDPDDAGTGSSQDAARKSDASASGDGGGCTAASGSGSGGPGTCTSSTGYQCGADTREIECSCPAAKCTCKLNGVVTMEFRTSSCPSCAHTQDMLDKCGINASLGTSGGMGSTSGSP